MPLPKVTKLFHDTQDIAIESAPFPTIPTLDLSQLADQSIFERVLDREWKRMQRNQQTLSLLQVSVDGQSNGQSTSQSHLQQIAWALQDRLQRAGDLLAYIKPDEFWVILPNTPKFGAVKVAESLRLLIENAGIGLSLSIGIVSDIPRESMRLEPFLLRLTQALATAKQDGQNCSRLG